jgi:glycolate oxidase iron-sulfur subunit
VQHHIPGNASPHLRAMTRAIETCVHCGFCLPACPTYRVLGEEMDSPRGRIVLMKQVLEGDLALQEALPHIDRCLGCLGCVSACPSGVKYGELLIPFRERAERQTRSPLDRLRRKLLLETLERPALFRVAARFGALARVGQALVPEFARPALQLLPSRLPPPAPLPSVAAARGVRRARVALVAGCVQQALDPDINLATVRVLTRNGIEVVVPAGQGCCGALALHVGDGARARRRAAALVRSFPRDVDAVITNAAGCGSTMKEYGEVFAGEADLAEAGRFAGQVRDVSEFLDAAGLTAPLPETAPRLVVYHDACHLAHGQGIRRAPRALLAQVPHLRVTEIPDGDVCCGSAGLYNLEHPAIASDLGARKAQTILATGAEAIVAGNIGCLVQIATHLRRLGSPLAVLHTMQVLDRAYRGEPSVAP